MLSVPFSEDLPSCWRVNTSRPAVKPLRCSQWDWWYWAQSWAPALPKRIVLLVLLHRKIVQKLEFIPFSAFLWRKQQSSSVSDAEWACVMSACLEFMFNSYSGARASIKCDKAMTISSSTSVKTKLWRSFLVPWWQWKGEIIGMDAFRAGPTAVCVLWYRAA